MSKLPSLWIPTQDPSELRSLGKLLEELNECGAAAARCLIQGLDEREPVTGKLNRAWLTEEIADVLAAARVATEKLKLNDEAIFTRAENKYKYLNVWHDMAVGKTPT